MDQHPLHQAILSLSRDDRLPGNTHQLMAAALIPIEDRTVGAEAVPTVNARGLHAWLAVGKDYRAWLDVRIEQFGFMEGIDYTFHRPDHQAPDTLQESIDCHLTLDMAKELSMVERNEKGKQARQYFIACEHRLKSVVAGLDASHALSDPNKLRTLLLGYTERVIAMEAKIADDAPKVAFYDAVVASANTQSIQDVAKVLGIGPTKCFEWLRRAGILMPNNLPYQCHIDAGYFKVIQRSWIDKNDEQRLYTRSLVTGKGVAYLQKRYQATRQESSLV